MQKYNSTTNRTLEKTNWIQASNVSGTKMGEALDDIIDPIGYDQFKNKKSSYNESLYSTTYDINKLTKEQIKHAERIDHEISNKDSKGNIHMAEERG
jgi:PAB1-binding protein PBP1